ncbi:putative inorganic phosphate cotransporter [Anticarsia gemmatalis]|uniref:putative inorganic phosphate cotransporter n=1 Tax=Anticarsia gemmatalis TaxID=129554 RepID=UPI003F7650B2
MGVAVEEKNVRPSGLGVRHAQAVLLFFGMLFAFSMRVNISMAIVDMTNPDNNNRHFEWSHSVQAVILSSFFWGYVVLQVPAGELARRFGGKVLFTISVTVNSLLSLIMPLAASFGGWRFVCICRVLQGLTQAFIYPGTHHLVSQWMPQQEKGLLSTIVYAGGQFGIALQLIASGFIATSWGWQAIFYTNGTLGLLWAITYTIFGADSPESSKFISPEEVLYIQKSLGRDGEQKTYPTPWSKILTSLPFWAVIAAHCGQNWGFFTLMTEMPTYMSKVLGVDLKSNGILSSLPYLAMYLLSFVMGGMTDLIVNKKWLSVTNTRKLFNSIGLWGPAIALIGLSYAPEGNKEFAVVMLTCAVGINAGQYAGYMLVHIDMAPNFSACLMGITNFLANIISIIAPLVCGFIVHDETEPHEWRKVFFVASGVYFFTNLFFILFGTSDRQAWNEPKEDDVEMRTTEKPAVEAK